MTTSQKARHVSLLIKHFQYFLLTIKMENLSWTSSTSTGLSTSIHDILRLIDRYHSFCRYIYWPTKLLLAQLYHILFVMTRPIGPGRSPNPSNKPTPPPPPRFFFFFFTFFLPLKESISFSSFCFSLSLCCSHIFLLLSLVTHALHTKLSPGSSTAGT